jgi:hypothetical protein
MCGCGRDVHLRHIDCSDIPGTFESGLRHGAAPSTLDPKFSMK